MKSKVITLSFFSLLLGSSQTVFAGNWVSSGSVKEGAPVSSGQETPKDGQTEEIKKKNADQSVDALKKASIGKIKMTPAPEATSIAPVQNP